MADYRIQNQVPFPSPEMMVNQNPPIQALTQGAQQGVTLGLQMEQQRKLAAQQELLREKQEMERADTAIKYLTDSKFSKSISKEGKLKLFKQSVVPKLNKTYGLEINPDDVTFDDSDNDDVEKLLTLVANNADPSLVKDEYLSLISRAEPERLPVLKEMGDTLGFNGSAGASPEKGQFVAIQDNQGVIWNPVSQTFDLKPFPGKGAVLTKAEPGKIGNQTIQNDEALSLVDDLESKLKGSSGIGGGIKSIASKVTAGGISPELRIYNQQKPAIAVKLYRAITGDTRLSDADAAARALPLLPDTYEASDVQSSKIKSMRDAINGKNSNLAILLSGSKGSPTPTQAPPPANYIKQRNKTTGKVRESFDGGKTWQNQ